MKYRWIVTLIVFIAVVLCTFGIVRYFSWKKTNTYAWCERAVLEKELGLSSEQKKQIESLDKTFELNCKKICKELHNKRKALNAALLNELPSTNILAGRKGSTPGVGASAPLLKEVDSIVSEISRLQGALEKRVVVHLLKVKQVLTPAQQKKFFSMIEEEMCKCEEHHGGMK